MLAWHDPRHTPACLGIWDGCAPQACRSHMTASIVICYRCPETIFGASFLCLLNAIMVVAAIYTRHCSSTLQASLAADAICTYSQTHIFHLPAPPHVLTQETQWCSLYRHRFLVHYATCPIALELNGMRMLLPTSLCRYHVQGSWLERYTWFIQRRMRHFWHHRHLRENMSLGGIDPVCDRIFGTYVAVLQ